MNAFEAFACFAAAHRGEGPPSEEAIAFVAERLQAYVASHGEMTLDEAFGLSAAGPGNRNPWSRVNAAMLEELYCAEMATLLALDFTVEEAAEAVAAQFGALDRRFPSDSRAIAAATARTAFYRRGGETWGRAQLMHVEALSWDDATRAARLRLIPAHALPLRFGRGK